jgi:hypothetical protein
MSSTAAVYARATDTVFRIIDGQTVIVQPGAGVVTVLNEVGCRVWDLLDGQRTLEEIRHCICDEFDADPGTVAQDVDRFIQELDQHHLLHEMSGTK